MLKITFLTVGTIKEKYMRDAIADYLDRMKRSYKIDVIECREQLTVKEEGDGQLAKLPENSFVIGGSDGLDARLVQKADFSLCLSKMTFTHQMARLILAEQLYRAMKINNGEKYHK